MSHPHLHPKTLTPCAKSSLAGAKIMRFVAASILAVLPACWGTAAMAQVNQVTLHPATVIEGNSGNTILSFRVTQTGTPVVVGNGLRARVTTSRFAPSGVLPAEGGTSCSVAGTDYISIAGDRTIIAAGDTEGSVDITVCGDTLAEESKTLRVAIAAVRCDVCEAVGTIQNDDGNLRLWIENTIVTEPASGSKSAVLLVNLSQPSGHDISIDFSTRAGTASLARNLIYSPADSCTGFDPILLRFSTRDFVPRTDRVTIFAGLTRATIFVPICADAFDEANETLFVDLANPPPGVSFIAPNFMRSGQVTIRDNVNDVGSFQLTPDRSRIQVDEHQAYSVTWTMPEGQVWRDLRTIDMRIGDNDTTALWVRWDEPSNRFSLCSQDKRPAGKSDRDKRTEPRCSMAVEPGWPGVLETPYARLHLAETSVEGSGATGREVTLTMGISFKPAAVGDQKIELAASNDLGKADPFTRVSSVRVLHRGGRH